MNHAKPAINKNVNTKHSLDKAM